eukprot:scaffold214233_cov22-Tisochrysis_lutea.AAC.1
MRYGAGLTCAGAMRRGPRPWRPFWWPPKMRASPALPLPCPSARRAECPARRRTPPPSCSCPLSPPRLLSFSLSPLSPLSVSALSLALSRSL